MALNATCEAGMRESFPREDPMKVYAVTSGILCLETTAVRAETIKTLGSFLCRGIGLPSYEPLG